MCAASGMISAAPSCCDSSMSSRPAATILAFDRELSSSRSVQVSPPCDPTLTDSSNWLAKIGAVGLLGSASSASAGIALRTSSWRVTKRRGAHVSTRQVRQLRPLTSAGDLVPILAPDTFRAVIRHLLSLITVHKTGKPAIVMGLQVRTCRQEHQGLWKRL
jgi:hypothetical protein